MAVAVIRRLPVSLVVAAGMLVCILVVALLSGEARQVPVSGPPFATGNISDAAGIFGENLLVLLLYTMGNVGAWVILRRPTDGALSTTARRVLAGRLAIGIVALLILVACRQAIVLGQGLAGFSNYFYAPRWRLWLGVLPHALPELTAIFLPAAAWLYASRAARQRQLLAITAAAVLAALPLLATAALIEVYVSPMAFRALTCIVGSEGFRGGGNCPAETPECPRLSAVEFEKRFHIHLTQAEKVGARRHCRAITKDKA